MTLAEGGGRDPQARQVHSLNEHHIPHKCIMQTRVHTHAHTVEKLLSQLPGSVPVRLLPLKVRPVICSNPDSRIDELPSVQGWKALRLLHARVTEYRSMKR